MLLFNAKQQPACRLSGANKRDLTSVEPDHCQPLVGRQTPGEPTRRRQAIHEPTRPTTYQTLRTEWGLPRFLVSGWLGRLCGGWGHDGFVGGGCQSVERVLASALVVGAFDPHGDRDAQLVACGPGAGVEHVLL